MISLMIPKSTQCFNIDKEIAECRNIKDKNNRNLTLKGLMKIKAWA